MQSRRLPKVTAGVLYPDLMSIAYKLPVFVQITQSRAGSDLLHSLLDSHPEVLQQPGSFDFPQFWKSRRNHENSLFSAWELVTAGEENKAQIAKFDSRLNVYEKWGNLGGEADRHFEVPVAEFVTHLDEILRLHPRFDANYFFRAFHVAYGLASGTDFQKLRIIFFDLHSPEALADFKRLVPTAGIVHSRRHPAGSLSSQIGFDLNELKNKRRLPGSLSSTYLRKRQGAIRKLASLEADPVKEVWLEELHSHSQEVIADLANFLSITRTDSLFESTWMGLDWWGDSQSSGRLNGLNPQRTTFLLKNFLQHHSRLEVAVLEELVGRDALPARVRTLPPRAKVWLALLNLHPTRLERLILRNELKEANGFGALFRLKILALAVMFYFWRIAEESRKLLRQESASAVRTRG